MVYIGPRAPSGGPGCIGLGVCAHIAGNRPVSSTIVQSGVPPPSSPLIFRSTGLPMPGPLIRAALGPLASATAGMAATSSAASATAPSMRLVMDDLLVSWVAPAGAGVMALAPYTPEARRWFRTAATRATVDA